MLVLKRKQSEGIQINVGGEIIKLVVVETGRDFVRIGFEADNTVKIWRTELVERFGTRLGDRRKRRDEK